MLSTRLKTRLMILLAVGIPSAMLTNCAEREGPLFPDGTNTTTPEIQTTSFDILRRNDFGDPTARFIYTAYATPLPTNLPQQPFPVLYLLHDFLEPGVPGGADYFERYNLQEILDDLYRNNEIGRMMVVTVDASNNLGGSYYRDASTLGRYEALLSELIAHMERTTRVYTGGGRRARAISGHGMGGYGAMYYAMQHPEMFGAVSSMSGPLSFGDVDSDFGILSDGGLLDQVFTENSIIVPDPDSDVYNLIEAGLTRPATRLYAAMAAAFSPHPLRTFDSVGTLIVQLPFVVRKDTIYPWDFFSPRAAGSYTLELTDRGADTLGVGLNMLFDQQGVLVDSIWALWRDSSDIKNIFLQKRGADPMFMEDMSIYIDCGVEDELGYLGMNQDFHQTLMEAGVAHEFIEYEGFGRVVAGHSQLIADRLRTIIKFHDQSFTRPPTPPQP
ncbi:MAG TPA: alpha/beta hydrolase-fold protein [candidate division Zixibacteria bacterium]